MRAYVRRILEPRWPVEAVADGAAALAAAEREPPALILTDVMMPALDGFALLRRLREDDELAPIPSSCCRRAPATKRGSSGLDAGADDYLVKPFSARELVARIETQLKARRAEAGRRGGACVAEEATRARTNSWRCSGTSCAIRWRRS